MVQIFAIVNVGVFGASVPFRVHCGTGHNQDFWMCPAFFTRFAPKSDLPLLGFVVREAGKADLYLRPPVMGAARDKALLARTGAIQLERSAFQESPLPSA